MATEDDRIEDENNKFSKHGEITNVNVNSNLSINMVEERVEVNGSGFVIYQGWAVIGSAESEAVWLISKLNYDENGIFTERVWANGEDTFDKVWDSRDTYNYSY